MLANKTMRGVTHRKEQGEEGVNNTQKGCPSSCVSRGFSLAHLRRKLLTTLLPFHGSK